jgi:quinol monooxygenase YgiN
MEHVLVRLKLEDYAKWRPVFDGLAGFRKTSGSKGGRLFQKSDNPNEVVILFEWESLEKARQQHGITYASVHRDETDPTTIIVVHQFKDMSGAKKFVGALPPIMEKAGVVGRPDIWFGEDVERVSLDLRTRNSRPINPRKKEGWASAELTALAQPFCIRFWK